MLHRIQSSGFFFGGYTQAHGFVDQLEHDQGGHEGPHKAGPDTQQLDADNLGRGAADVEDAGRESALGAADAMHGYRPDRIVDADLVQQQYREDNEYAGHRTDNDGA